MDCERLILYAVGVMLVGVIAWMWRRHRRMVAKVVFMFNAIDNGDYSFRFSEDVRRAEDKLLNASLNRVKDILSHARDEQMEREKYYELILDSVETGILVVDEERGVVMRCNKAALKLLHRDVVTHVNQVRDTMKSLSVRETYTWLKGRRVKILALSDIKGELANQEIDSWVKLIRVLTHEIMNTITPVVSLSDMLMKQADESQREELRIINSTSKELIRFVENYRKFTHVPTPMPTLFYVKPFIERMAGLAKPLLKHGCTMHIDVNPEDLLLYADEGLISRVVSNLLKNAAEATGNGGNVYIKAFTGDNDTVIIDVADDGQPIPEDVAPHIFIPFFTTKKEGSGIGLSISRQIMRVSNGSIQLIADRQKKLTLFRLTFN